MNEKKIQSRKRNQNQTQKKSRDRQAQPRNTFGNQYRSQFQAAFQIFCRRWLPVCIAALILSGTANLLRESRLQQEVAAKIVRFHVRANSDCASDQQILKLDLPPTSRSSFRYAMPLPKNCRRSCTEPKQKQKPKKSCVKTSPPSVPPPFRRCAQEAVLTISP